MGCVSFARAGSEGDAVQEALPQSRFKFLSAYGYNGAFSDLGYLRGFATSQIFLYKPVRYMGAGLDLSYAFASAGPLAVEAGSMLDPVSGQWEYQEAYAVDRASSLVGIGPSLWWLPVVKQRHEFQAGVSAKFAYLHFKDFRNEEPGFEAASGTISRHDAYGFGLDACAGYLYRAGERIGIGLRVQYSWFKNRVYDQSGIGAFFVLGVDF